MHVLKNWWLPLVFKVVCACRSGLIALRKKNLPHLTQKKKRQPPKRQSDQNHFQIDSCTIDRSASAAANLGLDRFDPNKALTKKVLKLMAGKSSRSQGNQVSKASNKLEAKQPFDSALMARSLKDLEHCKVDSVSQDDSLMEIRVRTRAKPNANNLSPKQSLESKHACTGYKVDTDAMKVFRPKKHAMQQKLKDCLHTKGPSISLKSWLTNSTCV